MRRILRQAQGFRHHGYHRITLVADCVHRQRVILDERTGLRPDLQEGLALSGEFLSGQGAEDAWYRFSGRRIDFDNPGVGVR